MLLDGSRSGTRLSIVPGGHDAHSRRVDMTSSVVPGDHGALDRGVAMTFSVVARAFSVVARA
jgi:hypothetical protein